MKNLGKHICLNDHQTFKKNTFVDVVIDNDDGISSYIKVGQGERYAFCCTTKYYISENFKSMGLVSIKEYRKQKLLKINESR